MTKATMETITELLAITDAFPEIKELAPGSVKKYFELIRKYAPTVASEPLLVGPMIIGVVRLGQITHEAMRGLIETERMMRAELK